MRLIDADALEPDAEYDDGEYWAYSRMQIENAPTIEPERKTGHLIHESAYNWYRCSVCKKVYSEALLQNFNECMYQPCFRYCPNCGARMEEGRE